MLAVDPKLAAYKIAVANQTDLPVHVVNDVIDYVTEELREAGVMVLNLGLLAGENSA